jgi:putative membrane protein
MTKWKRQRRLQLIALSAASVLVLAACATSNRKYSDISDVAESPSEHYLHLAGRPGQVTQADRNFVFLVGVQDLYSVAAARLAQERAADASVRNFARQALNDCQSRSQQLALISENHVGVTPPTKLDRSYSAKLDQIATLTGESFDRAYMRDQLNESERSIELFQKQAMSGGEPILQSFATDTLPELEKRWGTAKDVAAQLQ